MYGICQHLQVVANGMKHHRCKRSNADCSVDCAIEFHIVGKQFMGHRPWTYYANQVMSALCTCPCQKCPFNNAVAIISTPAEINVSTYQLWVNVRHIWYVMHEDSLGFSFVTTQIMIYNKTSIGVSEHSGSTEVIFSVTWRWWTPRRSDNHAMV